jgi:hypothetical protein
MMAVADRTFKKLLGFSFNGEQVPTLHVYDMNPNGGGFKTADARTVSQSKHSSIFAEFNCVLVPEYKSLEVSHSGDYVFIGGGQDDESGVAQLTAMTFDTTFTPAAAAQVGPENMNCVYSLRRLKEGNVLFCGGFGSVAVVYFDETEKQFYNLVNVEDCM